MNKYIISASQGGLSNRIKCLISGMIIADKTKRKLLLYWPKDKNCNCYIKDLFENQIKEISKEELGKIIRNKNYEYYDNDSFNIKDKKKFILIDNTKFIGFSEKEILFKFEKIPSQIKGNIIYYLKKLKIKRDLLNKVLKFSKNRFNKETIGVHIRKGDFIWLKSGIGKVSNEDKFIEEIKEEINKNPKSDFFLASENIETGNRFKNLFGNKIITYPKRAYQREKEGSVEEALIELLLLSMTNRIIGTFGSTFTELAWFFGNCNQEVKIVIDERYLKEFLKNKKKQRNLLNKTKKFIYELFIPESKRFFKVLVK